MASLQGSSSDEMGKPATACEPLGEYSRSCGLWCNSPQLSVLQPSASVCQENSLHVCVVMLIVYNMHSSQIILLNKVETLVFLTVLRSVSYSSFYMVYCLWYIILVFIIKWVLFPAKAHIKSSPHTNLTRNTQCSRCGVRGLLLLTAWFSIVFRFLNMASILRMSSVAPESEPLSTFHMGSFPVSL